MESKTYHDLIDERGRRSCVISWPRRVPPLAALYPASCEEAFWKELTVTAGD
jgi:hypothetical protein